MNTSIKHVGVGKISNKRSTDPFDRLIFEKGLRIQQIMTDKALHTMIILLNNGHALKVPINLYESLKDASQADLNEWELTGNGIGIRWEKLDEDLSLKALIKESALSSILHRLQSDADISELSVF